MKILMAGKKNDDTWDISKLNSNLLNKIRAISKNAQIVISSASDLSFEKKLVNADVLIASKFEKLNEKNSRNLKWIHITSAGTNRIPEFILNSKILLTNSSGVHPIPIAEHVFSFMLMLSRRINLAFKVQILEKKWIRDFSYLNPGEVYGKNLLIVGMGRIGERIAELGIAFGMKPIGIVRDLSKKRNTKVKVFGMENLGRLLSEADFVINCLPGIDSTKGIFDLKLFKKFKKSGYFINIGRGTTVVENDLVRALEKGIIAGAGLDVFEVEPLPENSKLWNLENVIITPHYSGWNPNYTQRVIEIFTENLKAYLKNEKMPNLIDKKLGY